MAEKTTVKDITSDPLAFDHACEEIESSETSEPIGENVIEWLRGQKMVTVQLTGHSRLCNRVEKYAEDYPEEVQIVGKNADGSIVAHIPLKYVKLTRPPQRELTEKQRKEMADRLAKARRTGTNK